MLKLILIYCFTTAAFFAHSQTNEELIFIEMFYSELAQSGGFFSSGENQLFLFSSSYIATITCPLLQDGYLDLIEGRVYNGNKIDSQLSINKKKCNSLVKDLKNLARQSGLQDTPVIFRLNAKEVLSVTHGNNQLL